MLLHAAPRRGVTQPLLPTGGNVTLAIVDPETLLQPSDAGPGRLATDDDTAPTMTVAVAQTASNESTTPEQMAVHMIGYIQRAKQRGARVVVFPEMAVVGYWPETINCSRCSERLPRVESTLAAAAKANDVYIIFVRSFNPLPSNHRRMSETGRSAARAFLTSSTARIITTPVSSLDRPARRSTARPSSTSPGRSMACQATGSTRSRSTA